jgi:hypothetical protein
VTAKNPHAVALGRLGGSKSSPAKQASSQRNATKPRRKSYRLVDGQLFKRLNTVRMGGTGEWEWVWVLLTPPYDRLARLWLRRNQG